MATGLVSIVVNNYNYARYLEQAIESALAQTYRPIEVIVVDDGSTDGSREILKRFVDKVQVVQKENGGQGSAFNAGIPLASGDYILLLDSDDYLAANAVETCMAQFPAGYARIYYRLAYVDESSRHTGGVEEGFHFRDFDGDMYEAAKETGSFFWAPTSANFFRASALKSTLPIPEKEFRICADAYVLAWTGLKGRVKSIDARLAAYRLHGSNNYTSAIFRYSDLRRLRNHLEYYYNCKNLLTQTCKVAGFRYQHTADAADYKLLKTLCVGYKNKIDSQFVQNRTSISLIQMIVPHLWVGKDRGLFGRFARVVYLLLLLMLPLSWGRRMIEWADTKEVRAAQSRIAPTG